MSRIEGDINLLMMQATPQEELRRRFMDSTRPCSESEHWARREIKRLEAERDSFYMEYRIKCDEQTKALHIERDELKADAMRYRWLRNNKYTAKYPNSEFDYSMHLSFTVSGVWSDAADPAVLDAQIDAAIAKGEK